MLVFAAHIRSFAPAHGLEDLLVEAIDIDRFFLLLLTAALSLLIYLAFKDAVFELNAKSRPDAHTWHLLYFNALLELRHHSRFKLLDFVLLLRLKVLNELLAHCRKICSSF